MWCVCATWQHGTFKQHLLGTWKILSMWHQPQALCRCGLFHSAYSNSYVNLAIFKEGVDRSLVQSDCGMEAEELIHKFCGEDGAKGRGRRGGAGRTGR